MVLKPCVLSNYMCVDIMKAVRVYCILKISTNAFYLQYKIRRIVIAQSVNFNWTLTRAIIILRTSLMLIIYDAKSIYNRPMLGSGEVS